MARRSPSTKLRNSPPALNRAPPQTPKIKKLPHSQLKNPPFPFLLRKERLWRAPPPVDWEAPRAIPMLFENSPDHQVNTPAHRPSLARAPRRTIAHHAFPISAKRTHRAPRRNIRSTLHYQTNPPTEIQKVRNLSQHPPPLLSPCSFTSLDHPLQSRHGYLSSRR